MTDRSLARARQLLAEHDAGTRFQPFAAALGIAWGCRIVRVHDVKGTCRARDVLAAVSEAP